MQQKHAFCLILAALLWPAGALAQTSLHDLQNLSLGQLGDIDVTSVSKSAQPLGAAPGSIFVITHDAIARSGAVTLPEILRLAPNLTVNRVNASRYIITARGFSGNGDAQSFANQLLVLIDGRTVYSPLFSGVYWDMQDVVPQDIERIEVISGPGSTLWGANAVNGVINIVMRNAADTQGGLVAVAAGNLDNSITLRYGGRIGEDASWRIYFRDLIGNNTPSNSAAAPHDHWQKPQGGYRVDWSPSVDDTLTFQGDAYSGWEAQPAAPDQHIEGHNLLGKWTHSGTAGSLLQVQSYYDHTSRGGNLSGNFSLDQYDLDVQHSFALGEANKIVWGGGARLSRYSIEGTPSFFFLPPGRTLDLENVFATDSIALSPAVTATLGLKLENDPYSGLALLPSAGLSWQAGDGLLIWLRGQRAIRAPTPFDRDVGERAGSIVQLNGNPDWASTTLTTFEAGTRTRIAEHASLTFTAFYNRYRNIRSVEIVPGPFFLNLTWGNNLRGDTYGFETWADYDPADWWHLSASFTELTEHFSFVPGASGILGPSQIGDDPETTAALHSSMNLGSDVSLDGDLRYVGTLPDPHVPAYIELNARIGWMLSDRIGLSFAGFNLLHARHQEWPASQANAIPRSFAVDLQWRF